MMIRSWIVNWASKGGGGSGTDAPTPAAIGAASANSAREESGCVIGEGFPPSADR